MISCFPPITDLLIKELISQIKELKIDTVYFDAVFSLFL